MIDREKVILGSPFIEMDNLDGYISPIQRIAKDIQSRIEKHEGQILMKAVHNVGFDVDKYELMKALAYDREQYKKGYADAMKNAVPVVELCEWLAKNGIGIPCQTCRYFEKNHCIAIGWHKDNPCPNTTDDWHEAIKKLVEELNGIERIAQK